MNEPVQFQEVPNDVLHAVEKELAAHDGGFHLAVETEGAMKRGGRWYIPVKPRIYPEKMFDYYGALAESEIALRDAGLDVHLTPSVKQKLFVVYGTPEGEVAITSYDGDEYDDLKTFTSKDYGVVEYVGYPFNSKDELDEVLEEVKRDHPNANLDAGYVPLADR